jgi:PAS domain S-box-containing protein
MPFLRHLPVKYKIMVIAMLSSGSALLLACGAFILFEQSAARKEMVQALDITAAVTAANSTAGLSFDEAGSVEQALKSLSAQPDITQAWVYDQHDRPFARYVREDLKPVNRPPLVGPAGARFDGPYLKLFQPINLAGENIGTIYLEQDLRPLTARLWRYFLVGVLVLILSAALAFSLSAWLQRLISGPLSTLSTTVAAVRASKNYSLRADQPSNDELGSLIEGFNEMLAQIQERDSNLERRVASRTQELAESLSVLNATLSSTTDGILVVNPQARKIFQNRRNQELWQLPARLVNGDDATALFQYLAQSSCEPAVFLEQWAYFQAHPEETTQGEIKLPSGAILDYTTAPVLDQQGRNYGRIWTFRDVTQSRTYEAALRESQARFQFIFKSVPVGIASHLIHPDGRIERYINDAHLRICGLTREQHEIAGIYDQLTHPEDQQRQAAMMQEVDAHATHQFTIEKRYLRLDGTTVWVVFSFQLQRYANGDFEELTTLVDITESKRAEAALRESEANYYSLVDQMPAGIFRKDKEGRYVFVNSWFCRVKGAKPEELLGRLPAEIPDDVLCGAGGLAKDSATLAVAGANHHAEILQSGRQIELDEQYTGPDGKVVHFHAVKSPVYGPDGAVVGSQGILLDVTQRKLAEDALAYERDLLRTLLENSTDHIYFKDAQSKFILSSNSQAHQFGAGSADELVGKSDFDFFGEEHARPAFEDEQRIIRTGEPIIGKIERETWKDGRTVSWVLTTKMPFRNKAGAIIGTFGISKDITPIKEAEARLEAAHQQLLETSRLAGMAEVATSVLHNVGNVLNSVNVSTTLVLELVKKSRLNHLGRLAALIQEQRPQLAEFFTADPRGRQLPDYLVKLTEHLVAEQAQLTAEVELTRKNVEHIRDIVTMQQNYAKVSGVVETVKLTDLVEDALRMNAGALSRHQVKVIRDYPAVVGECQTERHKVLQILVNLIRNAKYACEDSGRADRCLTLRVRASAGRASITVLDNGVGIPAENLTRIFNHGFTTRQQGHGFGLHSGALAARELGGSLTAASDGPGTGAQFTLELPMQPAPPR